jgi:FKBP-type peptidyl-prolyl cis-trans isomerase FkpA
MKSKIKMIVPAVLAIVMMSCGTDYKKAQSGLVYKIFPGDSKDSAAGFNNVVKYNVVYKINDSLLYDNHGKMPEFFVVSPQIVGSYSPFEIFTQLKKGDSVVTTQLVDTLIKKGMGQQIPFAKKGDQIKTYIKVIDIFRVDSIARLDYQAEIEKDRPRQEKEAKETEAKQKVIEEKELQEYFAKNNINPVKAPRGTYVQIKEKGTGAAATTGKFLTVKYVGRGLKDNQQFDAGVYVFQLGPGSVIQGWHDGLALFNQGGKGVLYVPGTLAYGPQAGPGGPYAALIFDVEVLGVSDTQEQADAVKNSADPAAKKPQTTN